MDTRLGIVIALISIACSGYAFLRWLRPAWRWMVRFIDRADETFNGRPATFDAFGRELYPPIPSLGERMSTLEETVRRAQDDRITALEAGHTDHESRIHRLEGSANITIVTGSDPKV